MFVELLFPVAEFLHVPLQIFHRRLHLRHFCLRARHLVHQLIVLQSSQRQDNSSLIRGECIPETAEVICSKPTYLQSMSDCTPEKYPLLEQTQKVPRTSYLHGHLVVSALQERGQVPQSTILIQQSFVLIDNFGLAVALTNYQIRRRDESKSRFNQYKINSYTYLCPDIKCLTEKVLYT